MRRPLLTIFLLLLAMVSMARDRTVYGNYMLAGTSSTTASASTGMVLDRGLPALWSNPAGAVVPRHEIYAGVRVNGSVSTQSAVNPSDPQAGLSMVGYLYSFERSVLALAYIPRNFTQASAEFGEGESRNRVSYSEATATYSRLLGRGFSAGISAGAIFGEARYGNLVNEASMDTTYHPLLWFARLGVKQQMGILRWGIALETPAIGKITVERPINVGYRRNKVDHEFTGAFGLRSGIGWDYRFAAVEMDILYQNTSMVEVGDGQFDDPVTEGIDVYRGGSIESDVLSAGITARVQVTNELIVRGGTRLRFQDPEDIRFIQLGLGGSYLLSKELLIHVSSGFLLPYGNGLAGKNLSDLRPFVLRGGVVFSQVLNL